MDIWIGLENFDIPVELQAFDLQGLYNPRYQPDALYIKIVKVAL